MRWRDPFPSELPPAPTVIIGNFDGVHCGHHYLLEQARAIGAPLIVLTFEPHPRILFAPTIAPFRLTSPAAKQRALREAGADLVLTLDFDRNLAAMSAEDFVARILVEQIGARAVVIGEDYRFGRDRQGDRHLLYRLGVDAGFYVLALPAVMDDSGNRFSSSLIRERIDGGQIEEAARLLGRRWAIGGVAEPVSGGAVALGFEGHVRPAPGYYSVEIKRGGWSTGEGIAFVASDAARLIVLGEQQGGAIEIIFNRRLDGADQMQASAASRISRYAYSLSI